MVCVHEYVCVLCDKGVLVCVGAHTWRTHLPLYLWCMYVVFKFMEGPRNQKTTISCVFLYHSLLCSLEAGSLTEHGARLSASIDPALWFHIDTYKHAHT